MADPPHHCGCHTPPVTWGGALACHCSSPSCGLTFSGIRAFDEHQDKGRCLPLAALLDKGMSEVRPGILGRPHPSGEGGAGHRGS